MLDCIDSFKFIPKCIAHEIIKGDMYAAGEAVFSTNEIRMEPVLAEIRSLIFLNGVDVFEKLLKALRSEPTGIYKELADHMESMYMYVTTMYQSKVKSSNRNKAYIYVHTFYFSI